MAKDLFLSHQQCDIWDQRTPMIRHSIVIWGGHAGHPSPSSPCVLGSSLGQGLLAPLCSWFWAEL